jgi:hypothetical protein
MLQEIRGLAEVTHRRPHVRQPGLFLIQLRSHVQQTTQARRKQTISVVIQDSADIPQAVKITHLPPAPQVQAPQAQAPGVRAVAP